MPRLLALDSSTETLSIALEVDGRMLESHRLIPRQHGQQILPSVDRLLAEAGCSLRQLDAIAFGRGPGSFTGLRITLGVVQGLAFGADLPVIPVSTLATLARSGWMSVAAAPCDVLASLDARMDEVYWAVYRVSENDTIALHPDSLSAPAAVTLTTPCVGFGSGCGLLPALSGLRVVDSQLAPRASAMLDLARLAWRAGELVPAEQAELVYLREQVAWQRTPSST